MATIGQILNSPESGWIRYSSDNTLFTKVGTWTRPATNNTYAANTGLSFNFTNGLRILQQIYPDASSSISVYIDGILIGNYNDRGGSDWSNSNLYLKFEYIKSGEHYCKIINNAQNQWLYPAAYDIMGSLKSYNEQVKWLLLKNQDNKYYGMV